MHSSSDIDLWNASTSGDREAFGQLFHRHYPFLFQYGSKICPDVATLEDTIQELFYEIWQKQSEQQVQSVKAYLLQALKYKLYKTFRNRKRIQNIDQTADEPFELSHETFLIADEENFSRTKKVLEVINKLPPRQKEVIYLKIYKGLSYEEVSEIMQINYQVVRNLLCQALKTVRRLLLQVLVFLLHLFASAV